MPVAREHVSHLLLIDGPLGGQRRPIYDAERFDEGTEFDVAGWEATGKIERYVVTRSFEVECRKHGAIYHRVIAAHRPRVLA